MNGYNKLLIIIVTMVLSFACSKEQKKESADLISGGSSKVWKETKEINAEGKKAQLTDAEKEEVIQFFSDGHFIMKSENSSNDGTWFYNKAEQNLGLNFGGANFTEYFAVLELGKNKMKLRGRDGSVLFMKSEKG